MNATLTAWNHAPEPAAFEAMLACCAATRWAAAMTAARPIPDTQSLHTTADQIWSQMSEPDWLEAFAAHPRIGSRKQAAHAAQKSAAWSNQEQSSTQTAAQQTLDTLAALNAQYEQQFGFTYIVCATGKSAEQMLAILNRRLNNDRATELKEAAEQQRQITQIRLTKWLSE
jgi:OHCU decarboxylase